MHGQRPEVPPKENVARAILHYRSEGLAAPKLAMWWKIDAMASLSGAFSEWT